MKYTEQDAIQSIRECYERFGDIDTRIYAKTRLKPSLSYIIKHFDSWDEVVRKAGYTPKRNRYDKELLREFYNTIEGLGYVPSSHEYNQLGLSPGYILFNKRGFTWDDILRGCGLEKKPNLSQKLKIFKRGCVMCETEFVYKSLTPQSRKYCDKCSKSTNSNSNSNSNKRQASFFKREKGRKMKFEIFDNSKYHRGHGNINTDELAMRINKNASINFNSRVGRELIGNNNSALIGFDLISRKIGFKFVMDDYRGVRLNKNTKNTIVVCSIRKFLNISDIRLETVQGPYLLVYDESSEFYVAHKQIELTPSRVKSRKETPRE